MLQKTAVAQETFKLLVRLMNDPKLNDRYLVGGTALALYMGHRKSVDLDLFSNEETDGTLMEYLKENYGLETAYSGIRKNFSGEIEKIKIDCVTHPYTLIDPIFVSEEGIRIVGMRDIAAMKLLAIRDNGQRLKDFVDIACLSTQITYRTMLDAFEEKYKGASTISPYKALLFHDDIKFNSKIEMLNGNFEWKLIEKRIREMTQNVDKLFDQMPVKQTNKTNYKQELKEIITDFLEEIPQGKEILEKILDKKLPEKQEVKSITEEIANTVIDMKIEKEFLTELEELKDKFENSNHKSNGIKH
jgi:hypothetical protein